MRSVSRTLWALAVALVASRAPAQTITTIAGNGVPAFAGDNAQATAASLNGLQGVAVDTNGNVYIADTQNHRVRRVASNGVITTFAGTGVQGFSGDNGPATAAQLGLPTGVTVDSAGNLYISDVGNSRVRRVAAGTGIITTVAGNGTNGFSGDNGPATAASLSNPTGTAVDGTGNLYIADYLNKRVRRVAAGTGIITTIAGNGNTGFSGDNGPATSASIYGVYSIALDNAGNLLIADTFNLRIRRVNLASGIITTIAGNGGCCFSGDNGPATSASFSNPVGVVVDAANNVYLADVSSRVRRISAATGIITTVAGAGGSGYIGDNGPATAAQFDAKGIALNSAGNLYIGDSSNNRVRRVALAAASNGLVQAAPSTLDFGTLFVGATGSSLYVAFTNGTAGAVVINSFTLSADFATQAPASNACTNGLSVAAGATCYFLLRFNPAGTGTRNGTLTVNHSGAGSPVAVSLTGNALAASAQCAAGSVTCDLLIATIAGSGTNGFSGDNGPSTAAAMKSPNAVAVDNAGNFYIADRGNSRIRKVSAITGVITTVAGGGASPIGTVGVPATSVQLYYPQGVAVDSAGNIYIADPLDYRVRKVVAATGLITTIAGTGTQGYSGDGGPGPQAKVSYPYGLAVDSAGNVYISDINLMCVRRVDTLGVITTFAGICGSGQNYGGDGGPATAARLNIPQGLATDSSNNLYITDSFNGLVRRVSATTGIITRFAGQLVAPGFAGDGGAALSATLNTPTGVAVDRAGNVFIADTANHRVRRVDAATGIITTVAGTGSAGFSGDGGLSVGAAINSPTGLAADDAGNIFIADRDNDRIRAILSAQRISASDTSSTIDSHAAGAATARPTCGSQSIAHGVWAKYIPAVSGTVSFDLTGSNYQTLATMFTSQGGPLTQVDCQEAVIRVARDGTRVLVQPKTTYTVAAGTEVWVLVTAVTGTGGSTVITPRLVASSPVPSANFLSMMPHIVSGGGYVTKLTVVNMSGAENNVAVNFVDDLGTVLSSSTQILAAGATMRVATPEAARYGPITTQWASIAAAGRISANLFYEIEDSQGNVVNTVGFNDDPGAPSFTLPVELQADANGSVTHTVGLALSNPNNAQVQVGMTLQDSAGTQRGTTNVSLPPYGHTQLSLNNAFSPAVSSTSLVGNVVGTVSPAVAVNVVALGDDFGPFFSTPPLVAGRRLVVPHIFTGSFNGGYVTNLTIVNHSAVSNAVTVTYYDSTGLQAGTAQYNIPASAALRIPGNEAGRFSTPTERWAIITTAQDASVNTFFEVMNNATARQVINTIGFNNPAELTDFTIPVELEPATAQNGNRDRTIGLALVNANGATATVTLTLLKQDGTVLGTKQRIVNANSQVLLSLNAEFTGLLPAGNMVGALTVHSTQPVAAMALEADFGPFSAVPVVSGHP